MSNFLSEAVELKQQHMRHVRRRWLALPQVVRESLYRCIPADPSRDGFHRETGVRLLPARDTSYHRTPAGADRQAARHNHPGPR